jgi:hypothetical protein
MKFPCPSNCVRALVNRKLAVDVFHMKTQGVQSDHQPIADFRIAQAFRKQPQNLKLALG